MKAAIRGDESMFVSRQIKSPVLKVMPPQKATCAHNQSGPAGARLLQWTQEKQGWAQATQVTCWTLNLLLIQTQNFCRVIVAISFQLLVVFNGYVPNGYVSIFLEGYANQV